MDKSEFHQIKNLLSLQIKHQRIKHGYSLRTLSSLTNIGYSHLSRLENNKIDSPKLETYLIIFEVLEISLEDLFRTVDNLPPFNRYPPES
ncbi:MULTISPECIES: helix-turn-helix domain-containing protein [Enterococcus]|uniref:helix-turn-helix domain-containing protein n=1 Tax=Enterococcus TaxID=1350 RepID=UPI0006B96570|nr:helix-turn-helix transcriptional regulator [Enterococcus sp. RIT-PI-f]KPG70821.1 DNA-binding protein [Enterococcus sp. RIT-PI-f]